MRIIGGKDYYDIGLSYGIDPNVTLVRSSDNIVKVPMFIEGSISLVDHSPYYHGVIRHEAQRIAVAFCDKIYQGVKVVLGDKEIGYFWSMKAFKAWADSKKLEIYTHSQDTYYRKWYHKQQSNQTDYFAIRENLNIKNEMIENKHSILIQHVVGRGLNNYVTTVNPFTLNKIDFAKALDPYTAFNELSMWISGVLGGTSPDISKITDDKVLIENHGMDYKTSFRGPRLK